MPLMRPAAPEAGAVRFLRPCQRRFEEGRSANLPRRDVPHAWSLRDELMATTVAAPASDRVGGREQTVPKTRPGTRLASLDAYRGFIMLALVSTGFGLGVLEHYPRWAWLGAQFDHTAWEGCTFWDLIQPAFTFMVGVSMPFAFARRIAEGASTGVLFRHVAWRSFLLIVLSNLYSNWGSSRPLQLQFINVLCQIAFGYMLCFLITRLPFRSQVAAAVAMLAGY